MNGTILKDWLPSNTALNDAAIYKGRFRFDNDEDSDCYIDDELWEHEMDSAIQLFNEYQEQNTEHNGDIDNGIDADNDDIEIVSVSDFNDINDAHDDADNGFDVTDTGTGAGCSGVNTADDSEHTANNNVTQDHSSDAHNTAAAAAGTDAQNADNFTEDNDEKMFETDDIIADTIADTSTTTADAAPAVASAADTDTSGSDVVNDSNNSTSNSSNDDIKNALIDLTDHDGSVSDTETTLLNGTSSSSSSSKKPPKDVSSSNMSCAVAPSHDASTATNSYRSTYSRTSGTVIDRHNYDYAALCAIYNLQKAARTLIKHSSVRPAIQKVLENAFRQIDQPDSCVGTAGTNGGLYDNETQVIDDLNEIISASNAPDEIKELLGQRLFTDLV
jgi:hypothetical protein